jgi:hypothetical protein
MAVYKGRFIPGSVIIGSGIPLSEGKLPGKVILALSSKRLLEEI